ncbi:capsular polysaccharide biosynthesis protein CapF [Lachnospiraceae bacterium 45-W7]
MKILITGARGFIGKNLTATLENVRTGKDKSFGISENITIYEYDKESGQGLLNQYCKDCDFVFHLAGVNRPREQEEYMEGNFGFTSVLLNTLKRHGNNCPVMVSSSIQAVLDNSYGKSKKAGEDLVFAYGNETGAQVCIYRFPNVFGKWCRPNYNSAVATFCHNIARGIPIQVNDSLKKLNLVYIDDVIAELVALLSGKGHRDVQGYYYVPVVHTVTLGEIVQLLYAFKSSRNDISVPELVENGFVKKLYATYLSYLPTDQFCYPLKMNADERGSFTEILRTADRGQFSVNTLKPGVTKGNHWHHTKHEKFVVVSGRGLIQLRKIGSEEIIEYHVCGEKIETVDIPPGYTHNIINEGSCDLVVFMWSNECFDLKKPDTYFQEVVR